MSEKEILNLSSIQPAKKRSKMTRAKAPESIAPAPGTRKLRKRVGRGRSSGMGKTSSRGQKGQKSRSGYSRKAGFEGGQTPLYRRLPKRGFTNRNRIDFQEVNLWRLEKAGLSGEVTPEILQTRGLIPHSKGLIKVLGTGEIKKAIRITADAFSESAKQKIEAAGGACTLRTQQNA